MGLDGFSLFGGLHMKSGLGAAAALAMVAFPQETFAQNQSGRSWLGNQGAVQTQGASGPNRGSSATATPPRSTSSASPSQPRQGGWQGGDAWRSRTVQVPRSSGGAGGSPAVQPQPGRDWRNGNGWRGAGRAQPQTQGSGSWRSGRDGGTSTPTLPANPGVAVAPARPATGRWSSQTAPSQNQQQAGRSGQWRDGKRGELSSDWRRNAERQREDSRRSWDNHRDDRHRSDNRRDWNNRGAYWSSNRDWRDGPRFGYNKDFYRWDRDWRYNSRYDWRYHRSRHHDVYRLGRYYSPYRDWGYSRLTIGIFLDSLFYSNRYWIDDPWHYRLPPARGPYRWIRYYDDALLVDIYSGEVIDVIYDFFW